jgi:polysaccharide deacetylase 2 family uncharacterized protein YibQ
MSPRRSSSFRTISLLMLLPVGGLLLFFAVRFVRQQFANVKQSAPQRVEEASVVAPPRAAPKKSVAKTHHGGAIVVILDDVGFDHQPLAGAMRIDPNVNFAVLPNGARSQEFARELNANGFELLCHLPMEPENPRQSPGANAVMTTMTDAQIEATTRANVEAIPHARGVNNHMGSRATSDRRVMTRVLSALPKGLYFIDSRTAGTSLAADVARELNIRTASRSVFLDDVQKEDAIRTQLAALVAAAESHGMAIGIGHMYPETVRVLAAEAPALRSRGFRFLRASEVVN